MPDDDRPSFALLAFGRNPDGFSKNIFLVITGYGFLSERDLLVWTRKSGGRERAPRRRLVLIDRDHEAGQLISGDGPLGRNAFATANAPNSFVSRAIFCASMTSPATR